MATSGLVPEKNSTAHAFDRVFLAFTTSTYILYHSCFRIQSAHVVLIIGRPALFRHREKHKNVDLGVLLFLPANPTIHSLLLSRLFHNKANSSWNLWGARSRGTECQPASTMRRPCLTDLRTLSEEVLARKQLIDLPSYPLFGADLQTKTNQSHCAHASVSARILQPLYCSFFFLPLISFSFFSSLWEWLQMCCWLQNVEYGGIVVAIRAKTTHAWNQAGYELVPMHALFTDKIQTLPLVRRSRPGVSNVNRQNWGDSRTYGMECRLKVRTIQSLSWFWVARRSGPRGQLQCWDATASSGFVLMRVWVVVITVLSGNCTMINYELKKFQTSTSVAPPKKGGLPLISHPIWPFLWLCFFSTNTTLLSQHHGEEALFAKTTELATEKNVCLCRVRLAGVVWVGIVP